MAPFPCNSPFKTLIVVFYFASASTRASVIRTIPLQYPALYPESFVWDDGLGLFITASVFHGALFAFSDNGSVQEFIRDDDYAGNAATVGVALDSPRRRLLVVVANAFNHHGSFDALAAYNVDTKERLFLARLEKGGTRKGRPNDVDVDFSGNAYVTDSENDLVWKVTFEGNVSVFAESPLFKSQPVLAVDPPAVGCGLNGVSVVMQGKVLLVVQTRSGKLFRVGLGDGKVELVDMEEALVAGDGLAVRRDGMLVVVSTDKVWAVKSRDGWRSAEVMEGVELDRSFNSTTVALRGPTDIAFVIQTHFQDLFTWIEQGLAALPGGQFRREFSVQEIRLRHDPDDNPLWLLLIPVAVLLFYGFYRLQMALLFHRYNRRIKIE